MRTKLFLAVSATALLSTAAAFAGEAVGTARAATGGVLYSFLGRLTATPRDGAVSLAVEGGNRPALHALLGRPVTQTFAYGDDTEFLKWANGVPVGRPRRRPRRGRLRPRERSRVRAAAPSTRSSTRTRA